MTFTQTFKGMFVRSPEAKAAKDNSGKGRAKQFLSKISGAFMLPVSIMAVAGLFLGVGAAIGSHTSAKTLGAFIQNMGDPIFGAMPLLFMVAIIIAFTDDIGTAVYSGIIGFLVFNALQNPFMDVVGDGNVGTARFLGIDTGDDIAGRMYKIAGSNIGITSMNTSIFGGIVVGAISTYLYKVWHTVELPKMIAFFGGKRFVPIVIILAMIPTSLLFLLVWPWVGVGFAYFGEYSGKVSGLDSFVFGFIERALIPFGLHHVFYAPLWWTPAGGDLVASLGDYKGTINSLNGGSISKVTENAKILADAKEAIKKSLASLEVIKNNPLQTEIANVRSAATLADYDNAMRTLLTNGLAAKIKLPSELYNNANLKSVTDLKDVLISRLSEGTYAGDSFGWLAVNRIGITEVDGTPIYEWISDKLNLRLGRFMQGKYGFMILALPAAGAAMVFAAPKENRKMAASVIIPASLTSFTTGVTEPLEFTFLFLAPSLFWGFHALMAGLSFLLMNILGAHVGMTFSGGIIDAMIYGALPFSSGTNFYWMFIIGLAYAPIYFFVFLWAIKKFNLETPGRGGNTKLFTKADYKKSKGKAGTSTKASAGKSALNPQAAEIVKAYGGWDNITKFVNCATRLRYDVKDPSLVDIDALKQKGGAMGVAKTSPKHFQTIVGPIAEQINGNIKANIGAELPGFKKPASKSTSKKVVVKKTTGTKKSPAKKTPAKKTSTSTKKKPTKK